MNRWFQAIMLIIFGLVPLLSTAQKTDTIIFYNGDRAICEIQGLKQGKLNIRTVAMGTISVEWRKISSVNSSKYFEIVLSDHSTFYGRINGVDSLRNANLHFGIFVQSVPLMDIVALNPISKNFWAELDGSLSVGFSFTRGTENLQLNSSGDVTYRNSRTVHTVSFNSNVSANRSGSSEKQDAGYRFQYYYKKRVYNALDLRWERNTELGIDSRLITTLSMGYNPVENSFNVFSVELGGSANREFSTEDSVSNNVEALLRVGYDLFIFTNPKIFLNIKSETFPSFTVDGRLRSNIDAKITWEIFNDFTLSMAYWGNYDSRPVSESTLTFDWGTSTTIGYNF